MLQKKRKVKGIVSTLVSVLILLGVAGFVLLNRQTIIDYINYFEYKPSALMASFAQRSAMSNEGKFLFYSAKPSLQEKTQFNASCPSTNPDVAILGCYNGQDIFIYDVQDTQLDGIRDVTAAYEMLHAAYKRLSPSDLANVNALIEDEYAKQSDPAMKQIVTYFAQSEPGQRDDELFSLIATQVPTISPQLETVYARYFSNRQTLVALYNKYSSVFTSLINQANQLEAQLKTLDNTIKVEEAQYTADVTTLNADINTFNTNAKNNNFSSQSDFDNQKASLMARADTLNTEKNKINGDITTYNTELDQYNSVTTNSKELFSSIDSLSAAPTSN
jgi:cell division septum initiation protein DivIVA